MTEISHDLGAIWDRAWALLERAIADPKAAARLAGLASIGQDGTPQLRTVVLRAASRDRRELIVYTDSASPKALELSRNPQAALMVWDPESALQLRLNGTARSRRGTDTEWAALHAGSRALFGGSVPPGAALPSPDHHAPTADPSRFRVLTFDLYRIDILYLGRTQHARALYEQSLHWVGRWIAP